MPLKLLGPLRTRELLANIVRRETQKEPAFSFPLDVNAIKNVLIVLPPDKLETLHQLRNILELERFFRRAGITLLAETASAPLAGLIEGATIVEYPFESKVLFSVAFDELILRFKGAFDCCCLLTHHEDQVLLNLVGRITAPLRIGYKNAGGPPFTNVHVDPSTERVLTSDWNCAMAEMLGARKIERQNLTIGKQTILEIDHLLKEHHIHAQARPIGIDALCFYRAHGESWADQCIETILRQVSSRVYLYADETSSDRERTWLEHFDQPVLVNLSVPQIAALTVRSGLIVTGNTVLFSLAVLLAARVVGVFESREKAANCPSAPMVKGVVYEQIAGVETIKGIQNAIAELTTVS